MFKPGEKLICLDDSYSYSTIKLYNLYTFLDYDFDRITYKTYNYNLILVKENEIAWKSDRFMSLKEYRKQKLIKICSKEIK